jgi:hypothetical protein
MKADAKPTLDDVAIALCKGATPPDWIVERLREWTWLISYRIETTDDPTIEQQLLKSALYLQRWLPMYARVADMIGEEYPASIDEVMTRLEEELIPFLAKEVVVALPKRKGGPIPDSNRHLCAAVCADIWKELHIVHQPGSEWLWKACEDYWQACGYSETSAVGRLRNWERYLLELSHP